MKIEPLHSVFQMQDSNHLAFPQYLDCIMSLIGVFVKTVHTNYFQQQVMDHLKALIEKLIIKVCIHCCFMTDLENAKILIKTRIKSADTCFWNMT